MHSFLFDLTSNLQFFQRHKGGEYENSHKTLRIGVSNIELTTASTFGKLALPSLIYSSPVIAGLFCCCCCGTSDPLPSFHANSFSQPTSLTNNWSLCCRRRMCSWRRRSPSTRPCSTSSPPGKTLWYEGQRHRQIFEDCLPYHVPELPPDVLDDLSHHFRNVSTSTFFFSINSGLVLGSSKTSCTSRKDLWCGRSLAK